LQDLNQKAKTGFTHGHSHLFGGLHAIITSPEKTNSKNDKTKHLNVGQQKGGRSVRRIGGSVSWISFNGGISGFHLGAKRKKKRPPLA